LGDFQLTHPYNVNNNNNNNTSYYVQKIKVTCYIYKYKKILNKISMG
jgi:hypothetical protein